MPQTHKKALETDLLNAVQKFQMNSRAGLKASVQTAMELLGKYAKLPESMKNAELMKWTDKKPTSPGWYWYEDDNYGPCPVFVDWCGFIDSPDLRQLEIETACGEECYQPLGLISGLDGKWSDVEIEPVEGDAS
jgi:hypothetical protein